jgi:4-hydroxythreonine-4-phosphate dehydrogenase
VYLNNVRHQGFKFGKINAEYGRASVEYLNKALELIKKKEIDCLVTAPVSKEAINLAGYPFFGQTEYLAKETSTKQAEMMLLNEDLRFVLASRHIAIKDVPCALNKKRLSKTIILTYQALKQLFLIQNPRIVVCGLNPHASDNGIIGNEENGIIKPLLKNLSKKIKYLSGPLPADVAIAKAKAKAFDCVIAMYHDQALIPLKLLGNDTGVNLTLGLPFVRTSPLHGTAFDIAATNLANPSSLITAIKLAIRCTSNLKKA